MRLLNPMGVSMDNIIKQIVDSLPDDPEFQYTFYSENFSGERKLAKVDIIRLINNAIHNKGLDKKKIDIDQVIALALEKYNKSRPGYRSLDQLIDNAMAKNSRPVSV